MIDNIQTAVTASIRELYDIEMIPVFTRPDAEFGDFATNVALQLAGRVGKSPHEVAASLVRSLETHSAIEHANVAGPGFINITLADSVLVDALEARPTGPLVGKTVLVEYSDPNPFKPLHAGHLYTTLVGDIIARLVEHAGAQTIRINFGGDVGLHVGKSMWAIVKHLGGEHPEKLEEIAVQDRPKWLGERYVEGNNAYEDDEAAKLEIVECNKRVYALHNLNDHESDFARIYWACREWSYAYFATLYDQLQVVPFDRYLPESEVTPLGVATVTEQLSKGVYTKSGDAVVFEGEKYGLHTRVFINSEGLPTYETKDVGLSMTKWQDYHFDESIIITAAEQDQYMQVVVKSIEQFAAEPALRTKHLTHGTVKLQGGVKMSSRKGNTVTALEILDAARQAGEATGNNPDEQTILAAVKYAFAKNRVGSDIIYDPKESIALEGNSGPYLQYAHARARSIIRKSETAPLKPESIQSGERLLVQKLTEYNDIVQRATTERMPHHICTYLYEVSQTFNRFYEKNRVIGDEREAQRLFMVQSYADTLRSGLDLLGISAPDAM